MNKVYWFIFLIFTLPACFGQRISINSSSSEMNDTITIKELRSGGYKLINPLLDCYEFKSTTMAEMKKLEDKIKLYIAKLKSEKKAEVVSVYFRDLSNGPWIGINEDEFYSPASLLKVPHMISALKQAENDKSFLSKRVLFDPAFSDSLIPTIVTGNYIIPGKMYTIRELLDYMIIYSDNNAKDLILRNISPKLFNEVFYDLGIDINKYTYADNFMSVKNYASYFRILYNATYLNKEMSELALSILSKSAYKKGITAGLPEGILVAHKFGERSLLDTDLLQLHDCGIIYKPKRPYILCVMTRGKNFMVMEEVISSISKMVYEALK